MTFRHTNRPGFLLGLIDFCTAGLFFLIYMPFGGLQDEIETVLGHPVMPYWKAYVLGIPTAFVYTLVWMARIAEELKEKAELLFGPAVATHRFFRTLNRIERKLNTL